MFEEAALLLATLTCAQVAGLQSIYRPDFTLFEYDPWELVQHCRPRT